MSDLNKFDFEIVFEKNNKGATEEEWNSEAEVYEEYSDESVD